MNYKLTLDKLEFSKVLNYISKYSVTEGGKNVVNSLKPNLTLQNILNAKNLVSEAQNLLIKISSPPLEHIGDIEDVLYKSKIQGVILDSKRILEILKLAIISRTLFNFFKENLPEDSLLRELSSELFRDKAFENYVQRIISENGEIKDSASNELTKIRKEISLHKEELIKTVNRIVKKLKDEDIVREDYVTLRDGRIVLPIKAEHKRHIRGFIHSESATGQTIYIEPEETLELNNDIISLTFSEKREIERILKEITARISTISDSLLKSLETISNIDSIFSRAKYSIEIIGCFPEIDNTKPVKIMNARHPILLKKLGREKTIPLNVELNDQKVILITGPNAGGKTVVLKTIGLMHLMLNSGIPIPCDPDSNFHYFSEILVDIGDEQSIEDDLSTFSSHLSNINYILQNAVPDSLVLLDEIGTGTDPSEGSAIAASVLIHLNKIGALTFATTHNGNLKVIAHDHPGFENAAMEFDSEKLIPTYRFKQGIPGSSYAFEIAKRIGLNENILKTAETYIDSSKINLEKFLIDLEEKAKLLEAELKISRSENKKLQELSLQYRENINKLNKEKRDIIKKTKDEAEEYLRSINSRFEKIVKELKESKANKDVIKSSQAIIKDLKEKNLQIFSAVNYITDEADTVAIGDYVQIKHTKTIGRLEQIKKEKAVILAGGVKINVPTKDLIKSEPPKEIKNNFVKLNIANSISQLDIRGKKYDEARFEVIKFVDEAYSAGLTHIEILHGKGTGALKLLVKEVLTSHDKVQNFKFAPIEFGGEGKTVIELKT